MAKRGKTRPLAGLAALDRPGQTRKGLDVKPKEGAKVYFYSSTKKRREGGYGRRGTRRRFDR